MVNFALLELNIILSPIRLTNKFQFIEQMIPLKHLHVVLIYLAAINMATFFVYGIDKWKAMNSKWRIRETALLGLAVLGGSIGAWLGMKVWHHKTQHKGGNRDIDNIVGGYTSSSMVYLLSLLFNSH